MLAAALQGHGRHGEAAAALEPGLVELGDVDDVLSRGLRAHLATVSLLTTRSDPAALAVASAVVERPAGGENHSERTLLAHLALHRALSSSPGEEVNARGSGTAPSSPHKPATSWRPWGSDLGRPP